ncbi:hypothetical protein ACNUDM_11170 [Vibrio chaetopteri]|uniref:hypothetical protein n=1 Tax=Vibrio chaetopteri TaxID=3016528 RepID=UPI003AB74542
MAASKAFRWVTMRWVTMRCAIKRWAALALFALTALAIVSVIKDINVIRHYLVTVQRSLLAGLSDYFDLIDTGDKQAVALTCLFTLVYGFVHSLGPGHGKSAVVFLVSAKSYPKLKIVGICLLLNVMQGVMTVGVVMVANQIFSLGYRQSLGYVSSINQLVGLLMMLFGGYLLLKLIVTSMRRKLTVSTDLSPPENRHTSSRIGLFMYGLRPCTSTSLIALFTLLWFDWSLAAALVVCSFVGSFLALTGVVFISRRMLDYSYQRMKVAESSATDYRFWVKSSQQVALAAFYTLVGWLLWTTGHLQVSPIL